MPSGFVFHESRVGSTLVANSLAANPWNMVFSESDPPSGNTVQHQMKSNFYPSNSLLNMFTLNSSHLNYRSFFCDCDVAALLHCGACTEEQNVQLFRDVLTVMGTTPGMCTTS